MSRHPWSARLVTLAVLTALGSGAALAGPEERRTFAAGTLKVRNLVGEIRIEGHAGPDFEVQVRLEGKDASKALRIETHEGPAAELEIVFPVKDHGRFVYPRLGRNEVQISLDNGGATDNWLSKLLGSISSRKIEVAGSGSGLEAWADLTVRVPKGSRLEVSHGVGRIQADRVEADLGLASRWGPLDVSGVKGSVVADTGSGAVTVRDVKGDVVVDTGSGSVELAQCSGGKIAIDTGSGGVRGEGLSSSSLSIDTGSGSVRVRDVGADELSIDTGSGSVVLELARMGRGEFKVDTGSGGIEVRVPADASAEIRAETGSGRIDLDLGRDYDVRHEEKDEVTLVLGGGAARMLLDTGSGGIRISR